MSPQIFLSHTKRDKDFLDRFDNAFASVHNIKRFRSEFEDIEAPDWLTIKNEMNRSTAMFLLIGKELVKFQQAAIHDEQERESWKYTQNWISYEVGLACQKGIDVWVMCDNVDITFPVPYLNNYNIYGFDMTEEHSRTWIIAVLDAYSKFRRFTVKANGDKNLKCLECGNIYNFWSQVQPDSEVVCPTCLSRLYFPDGWLVS